MANALTFRFATDVEPARRAVALLTSSIVTNMSTMSTVAIATARTFDSSMGSSIASVARFAAANKLALLGVGTAIFATFKAVDGLVELGKKRIDELVGIAEKAAGGDVGTDFFQGFVKGAKDLRLSADEAAEALKRLATVSREKLGGSDIAKRLDELRAVGNFSAEAVAKVSAATNNEDRARAVLALIREALEKGERLAALDIAERAFGPKFADSVRDFGDVATRVGEVADRLKDKPGAIIAPEEIGRAIELKRRMEEAEKQIAERFKPIMTDLAQLGVNHQASWVAIYETIAAAATAVNSIYAAMKEIPGVLAQAANSDFFVKLNEWLRARGLMDDSGLEFVPLREGKGSALGTTGARGRLAARLSNPDDLRRAQREAIEIQTRVRGEASTAPGGRGGDGGKESLDWIERYIEGLEKANLLLEAESRTVGLSNVEKAKAKALAEAQAAAAREGRDLTEEEIAKIERLAEKNQRLRDTIKEVEDAKRRAAEAAKYLGDQAANALADIIIEGKSANEVMQSLLKTLARQLLISGLTGNGAFGNGSGGIFGALIKSFSGFFADGGEVAPGQWGVVGERGPEMVYGGRSGRSVVPFGGGGTAIDARTTIVADFRGAEASAVAALGVKLAQIERSVPLQVRQTILGLKTTAPSVLR